MGHDPYNSLMEFTGERFTPECVREIWYEHWHRYAFCLQLVEDCEVLDLACGEGYGSHLLASRARSVVGMDLSPETISHASLRYNKVSNLSYVEADATDIPSADDSFDLVVCFETIEHLLAQEEMLAEFRRVLRPDGLLLISSPDKKTYSDQTGLSNPFHLKELYRDQFLALLKGQFPAVKLLGQKLLFQSLIWPEDESPGNCHWQALDGQDLAVDPARVYQPLYLIAVCGQAVQDLPKSAGDLWLFGDADESVYQHYYHEIRKNMGAGEVLMQRDREIESLREQLRQAQSGQPGLFGRLFGKRKVKL